MKGLICYIFRDYLGNSSNGGISSRCKEVVLLEAADVFDATPERPAVDRKSTRLNSSHSQQSRMPSSA